MYLYSNCLDLQSKKPKQNYLYKEHREDLLDLQLLKKDYGLLYLFFYYLNLKLKGFIFFP